MVSRGEESHILCLDPGWKSALFYHREVLGCICVHPTEAFAPSGTNSLKHKLSYLYVESGPILDSTALDCSHM